MPGLPAKTLAGFLPNLSPPPKPPPLKPPRLGLNPASSGLQTQTQCKLQPMWQHRLEDDRQASTCSPQTPLRLPVTGLLLQVCIMSRCIPLHFVTWTIHAAVVYIRLPRTSGSSHSTAQHMNVQNTFVLRPGCVAAEAVLPAREVVGRALWAAPVSRPLTLELLHGPAAQHWACRRAPIGDTRVVPLVAA